MNNFYHYLTKKYNYPNEGGKIFPMFFVDNNQKANFVMDYAFPLVVHETRLKEKPMGFNNWHWHEEVQFTCVLEGSMITTAQWTDYILRPGDGFFINSNLSHMTRPASPDSARYLSLNVKPSLLTLFHGSVVEQKYFLPYVNNKFFQFVPLAPESPWQEQVLGDMRLLFGLLQTKPFGYELDSYSYLLHIWRSLLEHLDTKPEHVPVLERREAHEIISYLQEHYAERVTLQQISEHVHLNEGLCCKLFRSAYGCSIFTYLLNYRLEKSILLLPDRSLSVSRIAELCGFNSTSYFIKKFREKVGVSPLNYRNRSAGA